MGIPSAIRYLRECYREDNVRGGYWNLFGKAVRHQVVFDGVEHVADGLADSLAVPPGHDVDQIARDVALRRGEFELLYGTMFVAGRLAVSEGGDTRTLCAPLLLYPLSFVDVGGVKTLEVDHAGRRLNSALLDLVADAVGDGNFTDRVADEIGGEGLSVGDVLRLEALLRDLVPGLDLAAMARYPNLLGRGEFGREAAAAGDGAPGALKMLPASAAAFWPKSDAVRGIVSELGKMAGGDAFSPPVTSLLGGADPGGAAVEIDDWAVDVTHVPAVLSGAQKAILHSSRSNPVTLANGPPGTGKSFTIAAVALDHLARGESVLVASKMDQAVDVVGDKVEGVLGAAGCGVRAGRSSYLSELKRELETLLSGVRPVEGGTSADGGRVASAFVETVRRIARVERAIASGNSAELRDGALVAGGGGGVIRRIARWFALRRAKRGELSHVHVDELERLLDQKVALAGQVLSQMREDGLLRCLTRSRPQLQRFLKALRSRRAAKKDELFSETGFEGILGAFPIWLVKLADVHRVLPLRENLFDLAIIDEATQCDVPSCLPVLQRARRVLVAGDLKQLRHISFLSRERQRRLAGEHRIDPGSPFADYREVSLLDLASDRVSSSAQVGFLNEHFRSRPAIIGFSNRKFYSGCLNIMTDRAVPHEGGCLWLHRCAGRRDKAGVNAVEVDAVLRHLEELARDGRGFGVAGCRSVGVLSPFRAQVDAIREEVAHRLGADAFDRLTGDHRLLIATAHGFQGEERDVMLLSLASGSDGAAQSLRFLGRPDVLNVAVTRAKVEQHVYCSFDAESLPQGSLVREYLHHVIRGGGIAGGGASGAAAPAVCDPFAEEVSAALREMGAAVQHGRALAGLRFDLIAIRDGDALGIDLLGYPGLLEGAFPIERYKMFRRAGMRIFPLAYSQWVVRRDECLAVLGRALAGGGRGATSSPAL